MYLAMATVLDPLSAEGAGAVRAICAAALDTTCGDAGGGANVIEDVPKAESTCEDKAEDKCVM
jgi:hypothetical protein